MKKFENFIKPAFCGVLILNNYKLLKLVYDLDWEKLAHHMTIKMCGLPEGVIKGTKVKLTATEIGSFDDKVVAVKVVTDVKTNNETKHITLAVNRDNDGKPFLSNKITEWTPIDQIELDGIISEFDSNSNPI